MRVLYVSGEAVPGSLGGSVHTMEVAEGLARLGHELTLLTGPAPVREDPWEPRGYRVERTRMQIFGKTAPFLALPKLLSLRRRGFDVVMARYSVLGGAEGLLASRAGIPLVLEVNSPQAAEVAWRYGIEGTPAGDALFAWERGQFSRAAAAVAPVASLVPEPSRDRFRKVDWGCDPERFRPAEPGTKARIRRDLGLGESFVLAFSGSFRPWHGADLLVDVVQRLLPRIPGLRVLCIGDGGGRTGLEDAAKRAGVRGAFVFVGQVAYEQVPAYLGAADAGIAPFQVRAYPPFARYGFYYSPLKLFEYLATGLPAVTTRCPELSALLREGETGFLADEGDPASFAAAVLRLAEPPLRARMSGEARRDAVERFSWAAHVRVLDGVLREVAP